MKASLRLLALVGGAGLVFQVGALAEEWTALAWLWGGALPAGPVLSDVDRAAVFATLDELAALTRHVYQTDGDPRFVERLPVGDELRDEILTAVAHAAHRGAIEDQRLLRVIPIEATLRADGSVEATAKEYWVVTRTRTGADGQPAHATRPLVVTVRYVLSRDGTRWRVEAWDFTAPRAAGPGDAVAVDEALP